MLCEVRAVIYLVLITSHCWDESTLHTLPNTLSIIRLSSLDGGNRQYYHPCKYSEYYYIKSVQVHLILVLFWFIYYVLITCQLNTQQGLSRFIESSFCAVLCCSLHCAFLSDTLYFQTIVTCFLYTLSSVFLSQEIHWILQRFTFPGLHLETMKENWNRTYYACFSFLRGHWTCLKCSDLITIVSYCRFFCCSKEEGKSGFNYSIFNRSSNTTKNVWSFQFQNQKALGTTAFTSPLQHAIIFCSNKFWT